MKTYKELVLNTNKELKEEATKLGYCIKVLKGFSGLPNELKPVLKDVEKNYAEHVNQVRQTKSGKYTAFYLLQYLYKQYKTV